MDHHVNTCCHSLFTVTHYFLSFSYALSVLNQTRSIQSEKNKSSTKSAMISRKNILHPNMSEKKSGLLRSLPKNFDDFFLGKTQKFISLKTIAKKVCF